MDIICIVGIWKTTDLEKGKSLTKKKLHRANINIVKLDYKQHYALITKNILYYFNRILR